MDIFSFNEFAKKIEIDLASNLSKFVSEDDITFSFKTADKYGITGKVLSLLCYCNNVNTTALQSKISFNEIVNDPSSINEIVNSEISIRAIMNCPYTAMLFSRSSIVTDIVFNNNTAASIVFSKPNYLKYFSTSQAAINSIGGGIIPFYFNDKWVIVVSPQSMEFKNRFTLRTPVTISNTTAISTTDGLSNTLNNSGLDYPAFNTVSSMVDSSGKDDWYIPARDELYFIKNHIGDMLPFNIGDYATPTRTSDTVARQLSSTVYRNSNADYLVNYVNSFLNVEFDGSENYHYAAVVDYYYFRPIRRIVIA